MKPEIALRLQDRLTREAVGLRQMLEQLDRPETAATMAGLKSGLGILVRSMQRTNQVLFDLVRDRVTPPSPGNPFDRLFR